MEIMVLQGDGIGPEIINSAMKILDVLNENFSLKIEPSIYDIGAKTMDSGKWTLPKILDEAVKFKAILKAPMGDPELVGEDGTEKALDIILGLRFNMDLFANVRPVRLLPGISSVLKGFEAKNSIDYTIVRENSEGLYSSHFGGLILRDQVAIDNQIITREGTQRIAKVAFELARKSKGSPENGSKVVTCVDKSNVLKSFAFFRRVFKEVATNYPDVSTKYMYGDAMAQYMLLHPQNLNVMVTENMFGDILSDLGAATVGGLGLAYSANLSEKRGMFEPVHGSAVDIAGKGIANPMAMILSMAMMTEWLGYNKYREIIEKALFSVINQGAKTTDLGGKLGTEAFTNKIVHELTSS
ncbi:MAG: isocitrate/isopropylmalate dehydrogenase family protein [Thermoplasmataceae archaeon]